MNLWHVEEEWVIEKSAEADAAVDVITWAYTQSHFTYNISGHAYVLPTCKHCHQTMQDINLKHDMNRLMCSVGIVIKSICIHRLAFQFAHELLDKPQYWK